MALKTGENVCGGICVTVVRKHVKRINLRVKTDGSVWLTVPQRGATLAQAEAFLKTKVEWIKRVQERFRKMPRPAQEEITPEMLRRLENTLAELMDEWSQRAGEEDVAWGIRRMKSRWGVCNWTKRKITFAAMLASKERELVEYVVVHELAHLKAHDHGPRFKALMDMRLPDWRARRRMLNGK